MRTSLSAAKLRVRASQVSQGRIYQLSGSLLLLMPSTREGRLSIFGLCWDSRHCEGLGNCGRLGVQHESASLLYGIPG